MQDPHRHTGPAPEHPLYAISVAAELSGAAVQSIRLWEKRGLLAPHRSSGGTRRYSTNDLTRIHVSPRWSSTVSTSPVSRGSSTSKTTFVPYVRVNLPDGARGNPTNQRPDATSPWLDAVPEVRRPSLACYPPVSSYWFDGAGFRRSDHRFGFWRQRQCAAADQKGYKVGRSRGGPPVRRPRVRQDVLAAPRVPLGAAAGCYGIQRIHLLRDVIILAGAGVGGGSLNYANTLYEPPDPFFSDPQWKHITDWRAELMPHYDQAQRMLGVIKNPTFTDADRIMKEVADEMGVGDTFTPTPVGVFFGVDGAKTPGETVADPYFGGVGPARTGCIECGECMTGCRHGAKNTLVKNYLGLAERAGAQVFPMTTVTGSGGVPTAVWEVNTVRTGRWARKDRRTFTARQVVLAAGTWGTQQLLFRMRDTATLPKLSDKLGVLTRTNSEAIVGRGTSGSATRPRPHPGRGHHVVDPSDPGHPRRTRALRQGIQRDGTATHLYDRRARPEGSDSRAGSSCSPTLPTIRGPCCGCSAHAAGASAP